MSTESLTSPFPLSHRLVLCPRYSLASFFCLVLVTILLVACGDASGKPSTSAPGGFNDPDALWYACMQRETEINDWTTAKLWELANDLIEDRKSLVDVTAEEERINRENGQMKLDLESNCAETDEELQLSAHRSDQESRSSSDCDDCLSIRQLNEEYEANSFATQQKYRGTRHNFHGTVESIDQEPSVPPKPLVRVKSDGVRITFRFGWDEDYRWVLALSKGDWVKANCRITTVSNIWASDDAIVPSLDECTEAD